MVHKPKMPFAKSLKNADPRGSRTLVTGVRDRKLLLTAMPFPTNFQNLKTFVKRITP